jgi:hypothetical protein
MGFRAVLLAATMASALLGSARAEEALLRPAADNTLIESGRGEWSNGSGPHLFAGRISSAFEPRRRALVRFDIEAVVPAGSTITRVSLEMSLSATNAGAVPVRLHRVLSSWGEGASAASGGGGAPAAPGDATWIHTYYDERFWAAPGGDFNPEASAGAMVDQPGPYAWESTPALVADAQGWLDAPEQNFGWMLIGEESFPTTVKRFDSREHEEEARRPLLRVEYLPPCERRPAGPGYWRHQCDREDDPAFASAVLPCAAARFEALGLGGADPCAAVAVEPPAACVDRALRRLAAAVFNLCAGRVQEHCPAPRGAPGCLEATVGEWMVDLAGSILSGECHPDGGCAQRERDPAGSRWGLERSFFGAFQCSSTRLRPFFLAR